MYACTMVIPYHVLIQNYMKTFCKCKLVFTHHHTIQCHIHFTVSSSFNMDFSGEDTAEKKGQVSLTMKRNTGCVEIEKWLKKEIAGDFLCTGSWSAEAGISIYSQFKLHLNQAKRCCSATWSRHATYAHRLAQKLFLGQAWANPTITWLCGWHFCMYVEMYGGHSVLLSNSKLHETFGKCKLTLSHHHTIQCHIPCLKVVRILLRRKGKVSNSLTMKKNTENIEIEKRQKKEMARKFLCPDKKMLFVNSKVSWSQNQHIHSISVAFEPGKEMLFVDDSKSQCNICTQVHPKIVLQSSSSLVA